MSEMMQKLENFIKNNPDPRELKRCLAVKLDLQGYSNKEISQILNVSKAFVSKYKAIFQCSGIDGLKIKYKGSKSYLSQAEKAEIIDWLKQKDYWSLSELVTFILENYDVSFKSNQSYYDLFGQAGISWKKTQKVNPKKDPEQVLAKREEIKKTRTLA